MYHLLCIENFEEICHFLFNDIQNAVLIQTRGISAGMCGIIFLAAKNAVVTLARVLEDEGLVGCENGFGSGKPLIIF